jgi:PAS domain-containing protein
MSDPGHPETSGEPMLAPRGSHTATASRTSDPISPIRVTGNAIIAVAGTGAVTAMNVTAVSLLGPPAPHQFGLGLSQFIPARYHRVIDAWADREGGDARAAHPDPLTLNLSALRLDGREVRVVITRRMLGEGRQAPYLVTMRTVVPFGATSVPPVPRRVRHRRRHPSPASGQTADV